MTTIKPDHPVKRETANTVKRRGKERELVVELHAGFLRIGPKGMRAETYAIDYGAVYHAAAKVAARG